MTESTTPKGWRGLVHEAMTKVVQDEIRRQLEIRFTDVKSTVEKREVPGFDYSIRRYIEERWAQIVKDDPEINQMIRERLIEVLREGFARKGI